jgi:hypothetical protein
MVDIQMAEETKNTEVEAVDPWDFKDPEIENQEQTEEENAPVEAEEPSEESPMSEELVSRAAEAGLTVEDMESMGSEDNIAFVLDLLQNKTKEAVEAVKNTAEDGDAAESESDQSSKNEFDWIDKLDPDDAVDSDAVKALKAMKSRMDEMSDTVNAMTEKSKVAQSDNFFNQLDEKWSELFGNGSEVSAKNKMNRQTVVDEMETLKEGYRSRKKRIPENSELFERALRSSFGEHEQNFAKKELSDKMSKRESQFLSRAQSRPTKELLTGREKAVSSVAAKMRGLGLSALDDVGETFE